ncbi:MULTISPECIES: hypothetical protein [unclassified Streptomyces]|uniref:hypothetical protein n=1 Tax=unclassified Streptomyces TaxID=2593676 RepID=UPI0011C96A69|nr:MULTISPECIES: hypothetical protein [unclassified Streptomyces]WSQ75588.1 hypothetical protein OG725_00170 [Streptomyces sp. NBC_01213]WSQ82152.1 hypothetical protein OG725_36020 [Streptomyces sp. NBC_01213]WSQ82839.1 hypothetical protein OG722_00160 [Streptomyces sp. NBC_01212]WSQ89479.1 hypothetical protein OG722_36410 [Streptomyces sp. NBC_01212]WSR04511.1 hypothetical protein OG265_00080 [Streptomyces sp. NBC_01208]
MNKLDVFIGYGEQAASRRQDRVKRLCFISEVKYVDGRVVNGIIAVADIEFMCLPESVGWEDARRAVPGGTSSLLPSGTSSPWVGAPGQVFPQSSDLHKGCQWRAVWGWGGQLVCD